MRHPNVSLAAVAAAVRGYRFVYATEEQLHDGIASVLERAGYEVEREVRLSSRNRIDLLVGRIGVEIKIAESAAEVARQIDRYLTSPMLDGVVLVTSRARHEVLEAHPCIEVVSLLGNL